MTKPSKYRILLFAGLLAIGIGLVVMAKIKPASAPSLFNLNSTSTIPVTRESDQPIVTIKNIDIPVELATTSQAVEKGLSGRASLDSDKGMLFIFAEPYRYRFWMPDMRFPLDMIWINGGKVVSITKNASTDFDPEKPVFYTPSAPAQYVLEVNAGFAEKQNIKIGDPVSLKNIK